ncbi:MAG: hypothetical protein SGCHY_002073 [Lobulomycetales sp.]
MLTIAWIVFQVGFSKVYSLPTLSTESGNVSLDVWKLQLPVESVSGGLTTISTRRLLDGYQDEFFYRTNGVLNIRTPVWPPNGFTTRGSRFTRTELREHIPPYWDTSVGTHVMSFRMNIRETADPRWGKVIVAQIHNGCCAVWLLKLHPSRLGRVSPLVLFSQFNPAGFGAGYNGTPSTEFFTIDPDYRLDTPFDFEVIAENGRVSTIYNGVHVGTVPVNISTCYFKIGTYSGNLRGDVPDDRVSHVQISRLNITHSNISLNLTDSLGNFTQRPFESNNALDFIYPFTFLLILCLL